MEVKLRTSTMRKAAKVLLVVCLIFLFLLSIKLMGASVKLLGRGFTRGLMGAAQNPFVGLLIGILATSILQSSSVTTSMVVGIVGAGGMGLSEAIPIIMGANIGTTVTNILVALAHITWREEFKRALAGATVHDFFNVLAVIVLFPLELAFGYLKKASLFLTDIFKNCGGLKLGDPIGMVTKPVIGWVKAFFMDVLSLSEAPAGVVILILSFGLLFTSLFFIVMILRRATLGRMEVLLDRFLFKTAISSMLLGLGLTAVVQSSSVATSLVVPLVGAGILNVRQIFPFTLGANVGTTVTALLASLATLGEGAAVGVTVAFSHLLFNITGIAIFYPLRRVPIWLAERFAEVSVRRKLYAFLYVIVTFFLLPLILIFLFRR